MTAPKNRVIIGSRASKLALIQTGWVRSRLAAAHRGVTFRTCSPGQNFIGSLHMFILAPF